jgi:hypothetical protein
MVVMSIGACKNIDKNDDDIKTLGDPRPFLPDGVSSIDNNLTACNITTRITH